MQKDPKHKTTIKRMRMNIEIKNKLKDNLIFMIERWNWTNKYWKIKLEKENYTKRSKTKNNN